MPFSNSGFRAPVKPRKISSWHDHLAGFVRALRWPPLVAATSGIAILAMLLYFLPEKQSLLLFGLYTVPSHILISPFPHEPMLLWIAKLEPAWAVACVATVGACLAGLLDYGLLVPLLNHASIRPKYESSRFYRKSIDFFRRFPFWFLVIAGFTPLPFFPFKFLSIAGGYPCWKYQASLVVGRTPRYYLLAWLGHELRIPNWALLLLAMVLFLSTLINFRKRSTGSGPEDSGTEPE